MVRQMLDRGELQRTLSHAVVVPVLRCSSSGATIDRATAAVDMGATILELTTTTPDWQSALTAILNDKAFEHVTVGVGTVTTELHAAEAVELGAQFLVSPLVVHVTSKGLVPHIQAGLTPSELATAGGEIGIAKIFPAASVGVEFLRSIKEVLPHMEFMPTGGITLSNARSWLDAGALAVGIGSALFEKAVPSSTFHSIVAKYRTMRETKPS